MPFGVLNYNPFLPIGGPFGAVISHLNRIGAGDLSLNQVGNTADQIESILAAGGGFPRLGAVSTHLDALTGGDLNARQRGNRLNQIARLVGGLAPGVFPGTEGGAPVVGANAPGTPADRRKAAPGGPGGGSTPGPFAPPPPAPGPLGGKGGDPLGGKGGTAGGLGFSPPGVTRNPLDR